MLPGLSQLQKNTAHIEKEALAATWACEKFEDYILGLKFTLETDHKPLVPILGRHDVELLPPHLQRFCLYVILTSFNMCQVVIFILQVVQELNNLYGGLV